MDRRTANLLQGLGLGFIFFITSRDVDRTMKQEPVSASQTKSFADYIDSRKPRAPYL